MPISTEICPLVVHQVCNDRHKQLRCVCAMSLDEEPPPEQSCSNIVKVENVNDFEAVSVIFKLDNAARSLKFFPEEKFRDQLASLLKIEGNDILILRVHCLDPEKKFAVQFVVVKNEDDDEDNDGIKDSEDTEDSRIPFAQNYFIDSDVIVRKLKVVGALNSLAGLRVDSIIKVTTLYPMEAYVDNTVLLFQAALAAVFVFLTCLCGCWIACKRNDYEADLQKN
ncbi:unnamed protein product [Bursaphelenchus xylophilus]|uniref:(pine wood nematode) hypothetical protein n=1 Tax=Bursaphelenchus xylophilus TaxID=6326 RepID=A0A1I7RZ46_BURXY|nr:unnamed protein product [Bursaphelenchus xylophilus]CAG9106865.1 unnamed protein product [Bursaphelenchus xylophilus]